MIKKSCLMSMFIVFFASFVLAQTPQQLKAEDDRIKANQLETAKRIKAVYDITVEQGKKIDAQKAEIDKLKGRQVAVDSTARANAKAALDNANAALSASRAALEATKVALALSIRDDYITTDGYHPKASDVITVISGLKSFDLNALDTAMKAKGWKALDAKPISEELANAVVKAADQVKTSEANIKKLADDVKASVTNAANSAKEASASEKNSKLHADATKEYSEGLDAKIKEVKDLAPVTEKMVDDKINQGLKEIGAFVEIEVADPKDPTKTMKVWQRRDIGKIVDETAGKAADMESAIRSTQRLSEAAAASMISANRGNNENLIVSCYRIAKTGVSLNALGITIEQIKQDGWFSDKNGNVKDLNEFLTKGFQAHFKVSPSDAANLANVLTAGMTDPVKPAKKSK